MRITRPDAVIHGVTWQVTHVNSSHEGPVVSPAFQGIEFRSGERVRRVALTDGELPRVGEFRGMTVDALTELFDRATEIW